MSTRGFFDSDSERIYFECWGDADEAVILVHGMGGSHAVWYQQVAFLAPRYRVVTWDQRGFGRSSRISGDIGPGPAVGDLERLLDHLSIDRAHIVGQSMGGWCALGFAIAYPDRTISLVLADSTAGIFTKQVRRTLDDYGRGVADGPPPEEWPLGLHPAIGTQLYDDDLAQSFLYTQLGSLTEPPSPMAIIPLLMATDHTERVARVSAPTLFIVGENDPIFPPSLIEPITGFIDGSKVAIVENTGHSPYFERPDLWNDIVAGFLAQSAP